MSEVGKKTGYKIETIVFSFQDSDRVEIETRLTQGEYRAVVLGPYAALELETLPARFEGIPFFCLDAPFQHPEDLGFLWIRFDPVPALKSALAEWKRFRSTSISSGEEEKVVLYISETEKNLFQEGGLFPNGSDIQWVVFGGNESEEEIRNRVRKDLKESVDLVILWSGKTGATVGEMLADRENGSSIQGIIGMDVYRFQGIRGTPFIASIEKDYFSALAEILFPLKQGNKISSVPYKSRILFDKGS